MRRAQSDKVQNQQLKVQEVAVRTADTHLYDTDSGDVVVLVDEPVEAIVSCIVVDDSVPGVVVKAAAALSIVDSEAYTAGGDESAIRVDTLSLAADDVLLVKYIAKN